MTEQTSPTLILTVKKSKVKFDGDFAVIDVGLTVEEFIISLIKYESSPHKAIGVIKEEESE